MNQLNCPSDVLIDKEKNSLIIADRGNNRVVRWSRNANTKEGEVLLKDIACWGLAMDNQRRLYVSDTKNNEVKRYSIDQIKEDTGTRVAGGPRRGYRNSQLNIPNYIFLDQQQILYVSDTWNHRVMRWESPDKATVVYQGSPRGLVVNAKGDIFVADHGIHQLVHQPKDKPEEKKPIPIPSNSKKGEAKDQPHHPWGLCSYEETNLVLTDHSGHLAYYINLQKAN